MTRPTSERLERLTAIVNGLLVFGVPTSFMMAVVVADWGQPWPADIAEFRPSTRQVLLESLQFGLVFAALGVVTAWRTRVHARGFMSGESRGWSGVGEAAVCGFLVALLYLSPGILTRPREAPGYIIFYGSAAAVLGAIVGLVLRTSARVVLRIFKPAPVQDQG